MGDYSNLSLTWRSVMMAMVCLPILISALLLIFKKVEQTPSKLLGTVLFAAVFIQMPQIIGFAGFYRVWPGLTFFPFATDLWLGPLVYLHAYSLIQSDRLGWRKWLVLPGAIQSTYYVMAFLFLGDYQDKWAFSESYHQPYIVPIESALGVLMIVLSLYFVWQMYNKYKIFIANTESRAIEFDPVWLKRLIVVMIIASILYSLTKLLSISWNVSYIAAFPLQVLIMLSVAWLSIEAVWRLSLPFPKMNVTTNTFVEPNKYPQTTSKNPQMRNLQEIENAEKIKQAVISKQWFLEPRFSLKQLAANMASNEVYVSRAINQGLQVSFNDFINGLRIEHAKNLLNNTELPLLTIALESGFNSKATFNRVFKDVCQQTPSQYKQQNSLKT